MCIRDRSLEELTEKIVDTNLRIDTLENNFKQALHEQVVQIENKQKELRLEWRKDLKESHKQINENLNDTLTTMMREQDDKIQTVSNMSQANTSKLRDIETRTVVIENRIEETTKDRSGDVSHMKEEIQEEMNQLRSELRRRQNQMTMFPTPVSYTHLDVYKRQSYTNGRKDQT